MENEKKLALLRNALTRYAPAEAVDALTQYIVSHGVHLRITRHRKGKYGDYCMPSPSHPYHAISVNGDLTRPFFLWVLLHEMAHLNCCLQYGRTVESHGHEWQQCYRTLLKQYASIFPYETQPLLAKYLKRIPLSHSVGKEIEVLLQHCGTDSKLDTDFVILNSLPTNTTFRLVKDPDKLFQNIEKRRTRWLCLCLSDNRYYLIQGTAEVIEEDTPTPPVFSQIFSHF